MTKSNPNLLKLILMNFCHSQCFFTFFIFADVTLNSFSVISVATFRTNPISNFNAFIGLDTPLLIVTTFLVGMEIV